MLRPEISVDELIAIVEKAKRREGLGRLLGALRAMRTVTNRLRATNARSNAEWTERMRELLEAAAWGPGQRETSVEFQTRRKWDSALDELATLDFDGMPTEFAQALHTVERIARQTTFAPESRDAPVQVMGPLEAAGGSFDAVWFLRGGELDWPMEVRGNSLLPWQMQRDLGMPGTDVARDSEAARRMTERIAESAETVVFSYARESAEGKQRISPLLTGLGFEEVEATEMAGVAIKRVAVEI